MQRRPAVSQVPHHTPANKQPRRLLLVLGRVPGIALAEQEFNLGKLPSGEEGEKKKPTTTTPPPSQNSTQAKPSKSTSPSRRAVT